MPTLKLQSLECIRQHDITGSDTVHVNVNGGQVWNGSMKKGETEILSGGRSDEVDFVTSVDVVLHEVSGNNNHQQIGGMHRVNNGLTNNGKTVFQTSGTHYELEYKVVA